jgi:hypothetical protein
MGFFDSWWFNIVKATIQMVGAGVLAAQAHGDVTLPTWLAPIIMALGGLLQVGQKK